MRIRDFLVVTAALTPSVSADWQFRSRPDLTPPRLNITVSAAPALVEKGLIFVAPYPGFTPTSHGPIQPAPYIFRDDGELVWSGIGHIAGWAANFRPDTVDGSTVLRAFQGQMSAQLGIMHGHHLILNENVDKDDEGNYLVSARNYAALFKVSGATGKVIWQLGGLHGSSSFDVDPAARFAYQHDARFLNRSSDGAIEYLSLFDNSAHSPTIKINPFSRGRILQLNHTEGTVKAAATYPAPDQLSAQTQGNTQVLPNSNVFVNWGQAGAITEFAADGTVLFHAYLDSEPGGNSVQSYRGYKLPWTGRPIEEPAVVALGSEASDDVDIYVSWNGDTQTTLWRFYAEELRGDVTRKRFLGDSNRHGFETHIKVKTFSSGEDYRIVAEAVDENEHRVYRSEMNMNYSTTPLLATRKEASDSAKLAWQNQHGDQSKPLRICLGHTRLLSFWFLVLISSSAGAGSGSSSATFLKPEHSTTTQALLRLPLPDETMTQREAFYHNMYPTEFENSREQVDIPRDLYGQPLRGTLRYCLPLKYGSSFLALHHAPAAHWSGPGPGNPGRQIYSVCRTLGDRACCCSGCAPQNCWGSTVVRASYQDDEKFERAVAAIRRLALVTVDYDESLPRGEEASPCVKRAKLAAEPEEELDEGRVLADRTNEMNWLQLVNDVQARQSDPTEALTTDQIVSEEFKYRFHTTVIQDKDLLDHAEPEKAEEYFQAKGWEERESGARSAFFMYLDDETIDHLAGAPDDQALARMTIDERCRIAWNYWVKIVEPMAPEIEDDESGDEDREAFLEVEDSQGRRSRKRRIRLLCLLSLYLASKDYSFDEIPNEGADCTRYANPQDETKAWCFVSGISCETPPMIHGWLTEIYGYKERKTLPQTPYRPETPAFLEDLRIWRENRTRKKAEAALTRPPAPESSFAVFRHLLQPHWERTGPLKPGLRIRQYFATMNDNFVYCADCKPQNCWGSTIVRATYREGNDARFKRAVAAIRRLTLVSVDHDDEAPHLDSPDENVPVPRRRLVRENEVDQQTLETHWREAAREIRQRGPPRFLKTDQILSEEFSDDELDTMTLEERCRIASRDWVKVVSPLAEDLGKTEDDTKQAAGRRRIRLINILPVYMRLLAVTGLEEVKLEEVAREDETEGLAKQWCLIEGYDALLEEDIA
ncbi:conserved hypothetical protein [Verticillium alfalfae VaMs.102]|uniref:Uncharacterized protein n=1 Tax=Verticillium alfalfae (strain VaMs.102 / ATCC MYA-4576 / FGSC 10136) TaxID=526221 RepID=C9SNZ3_VERA1|nr:conserved hypothetical protein [Verticillium alfalfae VaMs.102]EEY20508.1 conserved hypothetical protein [Verticillium alfalfae VaMs.102]